MPAARPLVVLAGVLQELPVDHAVTVGTLPPTDSSEAGASTAFVANATTEAKSLFWILGA